MTKYYGKYRGKVENNVDPYMKGRIQVSCPAVFGDNSQNWAMPCVPYAANGKGFFMIPPNGANVWVEFESGDMDRAIWSGCFWDDGQAPAPLAAQKVIKTDACTITLMDLPTGAVTIETSTGMKIELTATALNVTNGQNATIEMMGPKVTVNGGALEVM
jgi:hypothetical protein